MGAPLHQPRSKTRLAHVTEVAAKNISTVAMLSPTFVLFKFADFAVPRDYVWRLRGATTSRA